MKVSRSRPIQRSSRRAGGLWLVALSLVLAMYLTILPLSIWPLDYRPQWVVLTVLFWCFAMPERVGVLLAFALGLMLDVLTGTLLGQHALGLSVTAYLAVVLRPRIRIFPLWQQSFLVCLILLAERLLTLWVMGATGQPMPPLSYWISTLIGLALWPFIALLLNPIDRRVGAA